MRDLCDHRVTKTNMLVARGWVSSCELSSLDAPSALSRPIDGARPVLVGLGRPKLREEECLLNEKS